MLQESLMLPFDALRALKVTPPDLIVLLDKPMSDHDALVRSEVAGHPDLKRLKFPKISTFYPFELLSVGYPHLISKTPEQHVNLRLPLSILVAKELQAWDGPVHQFSQLDGKLGTTISNIVAR
jgi:hypothetical protein